jgi:tungstate transport system ATP-binding protein
MSTQPLVSLNQAHVQYRSANKAIEGLSNVSLDIQSGQKIAIVGGNGSGKTTLLKLIGGLGKSKVKNPIGVRCAMLFQYPYLLNASVLNNIALAHWLQGHSWKAAKDAALVALSQVGLAALASRNAKQLSGGQRQRVAIARALVIDPTLLLLDEPTASLDPAAKSDIEQVITQLASNPLLTLVFASHNLGQVKRLASRVLYLEAGTLVADLPVEQFFDATFVAKHYPSAALFLKGELH